VYVNEEKISEGKNVLSGNLFLSKERIREHSKPCTALATEATLLHTKEYKPLNTALEMFCPG
jgi:hypothetical protein